MRPGLGRLRWWIALLPVLALGLSLLPAMQGAAHFGNKAVRLRPSTLGPRPKSNNFETTSKVAQRYQRPEASTAMSGVDQSASPTTSPTAAPQRTPAMAPPPAVVTNCQTYNATGMQGLGLRAALRSSAQIIFNCDPILSGGLGPYAIVVTGTITLFTRTSIDGSDNSRDDITISGGDTQQILLIRRTATLTLSHLTLAHGNSAGGTGTGGAIEADGNLALIDTTFQANHSGRLGGAIDIGSNQPSSGPTILVNGSTFFDDSAGSYGGAIEADATGALVRITNSTFVRNAAGGAGGAIRGALGKITIANSTFSANTAHYGGALSNGGTMIVRNSILSENGDTCNGFTPISDGGYNLEFPAGSATDYCNFSATRGDIFVDPLLGPLADNGGPTVTAVPAANSPAIGTGNPAGCRDAAGARLAIDQRGLSRPYPRHGRCGIGAVEAQPFSTLTLHSAANPTDIGQALMITATTSLSSTGDLTPTGTIAITLTDPTGIGTPLASGIPITTAEPVLVTAPGTLFSHSGAYTINAVYSGNRAFPSTSATLEQIVRPCGVVADLQSSAGLLDIAATTAITTTAQMLSFSGVPGSFLIHAPAIITCDNSSPSVSSAVISGVATSATGAFAVGDQIMVMLLHANGGVVTNVTDERLARTISLVGPFAAGSFAHVETP